MPIKWFIVLLKIPPNFQKILKTPKFSVYIDCIIVITPNQAWNKSAPTLISINYQTNKEFNLNFPHQNRIILKEAINTDALYVFYPTPIDSFSGLFSERRSTTLLLLSKRWLHKNKTTTTIFPATIYSLSNLETRTELLLDLGMISIRNLLKKECIYGETISPASDSKSSSLKQKKVLMIMDAQSARKNKINEIYFTIQI